MDSEAALGRAKELLVSGSLEEARAAADEAVAAFPDDRRVREYASQLHLARGVRISGLAREQRRSEIEARGAPGQPFEDSDAVRAAFLQAIDAFDRAVELDPSNPKALALRANALFRMDRANRGEALATYDTAIALAATAVPEDARLAAKRNLSRDRARIEEACDWCDDTGFCTECGGAGRRRTLGITRRCDACLGHGVCKRCGVL